MANEGAEVKESEQVYGCLWIALAVGLCAVVWRACDAPPGAGLEEDAVVAHRRHCMRCVQIDDQLLVVEQWERKSRGFLGNKQEVCRVCSEGLKEVTKAWLMIDLASEAGCLGLEEYRSDANKAADSFLKSREWYRCQ
jgi:hypothetical protein